MPRPLAELHEAPFAHAEPGNAAGLGGPHDQHRARAKTDVVSAFDQFLEKLPEFERSTGTCVIEDHSSVPQAVRREQPIPGFDHNAKLKGFSGVQHPQIPHVRWPGMTLQGERDFGQEPRPAYVVGGFFGVSFRRKRAEQRLATGQGGVDPLHDGGERRRRLRRITANGGVKHLRRGPDVGRPHVPGRADLHAAFLVSVLKLAEAARPLLR